MDLGDIFDPINKRLVVLILVKKIKLKFFRLYDKKNLILQTNLPRLILLAVFIGSEVKVNSMYKHLIVKVFEGKKCRQK